jgi:hypothetical protein
MTSSIARQAEIACRCLVGMVMIVLACAGGQIVGLGDQDENEPSKNEPSKDDTIKFIKNKMEGSGTNSVYAVTFQTQDIFNSVQRTFASSITQVESSDSCQILVRGKVVTSAVTQTIVTWHEGPVKNSTVSVESESYLDLSKVAANAVKVIDFDPHAGVRAMAAGGVTVSTIAPGPHIFALQIDASEKNAFRFVSTTNGNRQTLTGERMWMYFADGELATRLAKATTHLAKLCGSTDEPF